MFLCINNVDILLILLYCLLLLAYSSYLWLKFRKNCWTIENLFLLLILTFYIFIPINIIVFGGNIYESTLHYYLIPTSKFVSFSSFFITFLFILTFIVGGAVQGSSLKLVKIYIRTFNGINLYQVAPYFLAFLSLVSLLIYIQQFGGFSSFVVNLIINRSGRLDQSLVGQYAFFGRFIDLAIIPIVYFLYEKRKTKRDVIFLFFMPLGVLLFSNLFISVSKLKFISLVLLFYLTVSIRQNKLYLQFLFVIFTVVFFALPVLDEIFILAYKVYDDEGFLAVPFKIASAILSGSLGQGQYESFLKDNSGNSYLKSVQYFTFIQMSLQFSIDNSYPLLFFRDFFTGFIRLLPSRLNIQTGVEVYQLNTSIFYGYYPDLPVLTWGVPPGIIAFGIYSLSVPGVLIIAFLLGYLFRAVDLFFKSIVEIDRSFSSFYAYTLFILGVYTMNGSPKDVIYDFTFLVFLFVFFLISFRFEILPSEDTKT